MKKKIVWSLLFLIFFIFLGYIFLWEYYLFLWNKFYAQWEYKNAFFSHIKANNFIKNKGISYNLWLDNYKLGDYEKAKIYFESIKTWWNTDFEKKLFFNLGNTLFFLWEKEAKIEKKIQDWEKSLDYFSKSLAIKNEKETKENYDYVKKKLDELKKLQEKENKEKEDEKKSEDTEQQNQEKTGSGSEQKQAQLQKSKNGEKSTSWKKSTGQSSKEALSQDEKEYLEWYKNYLEKSQKENQAYFNNGTGSSSDDLFDSFLSDPFFDNAPFWKNEKDW